MTSTRFATNGYRTVKQDLNSDKGLESQAFELVNGKFFSLDPNAVNYQPRRFEALMANQALWKILFLDLARTENPLPLALKSNLMGLFEFIQSHTQAVMQGDANHQVLVDINSNIVKGLRGRALATGSAPNLEVA